MITGLRQARQSSRTTWNRKLAPKTATPNQYIQNNQFIICPVVKRADPLSCAGLVISGLVGSGFATMESGRGSFFIVTGACSVIAVVAPDLRNENCCGTGSMGNVKAMARQRINSQRFIL